MKKKLIGPRTQLSGLKLEQERWSSGMSKAELARRIGTTRQTIFNWCNGGTRDIDAATFKRLKAALRCEDKDLLVTVK